MSTTTPARTKAPTLSDASLPRILQEGYGPGAWHGPDLKAALADVSPEAAFWRPEPGRHNIAEIALHHAYCARSVRAQLSGTPVEAFVMEGEDWFALSGRGGLSWAEVQAAVESEQSRLASVVAGLSAGRAKSPLSETQRLDLVLGVACHAIYHAGQIQLLKRMQARQA